MDERQSILPHPYHRQPPACHPGEAALFWPDRGEHSHQQGGLGTDFYRANLVGYSYRFLRRRRSHHQPRSSQSRCCENSRSHRDLPEVTELTHRTGSPATEYAWFCSDSGSSRSGPATIDGVLASLLEVNVTSTVVLFPTTYKGDFSCRLVSFSHLVLSQDVFIVVLMSVPMREEEFPPCAF
jgi:hypothetical protein